MNRDDIGELWVQALKDTSASEIIYKFAELVAAAEREECAQACEAAIARISDAAIIGFERRDAGINVCSDLADAIRARGQA